MNTYASLMQTIKERHQSAVFMHEVPSPIPDYVKGEFLYLQLRKICESIALGCLYAHSDIEETQSNSLQGRYEADRIIKALGKIKPDFYPIPVEIDSSTNPPAAKDMTQNYLTREDLIALYYECGQALHVGSAAARSKGPLILDEEKILQWYNKAYNLIANHRVKLSVIHYELWVALGNATTPAEVRLMWNGPFPEPV